MSFVQVGKYCIQIDEQDRHFLRAHSYHGMRNRSGKVYMTRNTTRRGEGLAFPLAREIMGATKGSYVGYRNGDTLDLRRSNLLLTMDKSLILAGKKRSGSSRYRGVYRGWGRWKAQISLHGVNTSLGSYDREEDAARAYDEAARKAYGDNAKLNFANDSLSFAGKAA